MSKLEFGCETVEGKLTIHQREAFNARVARTFPNAKLVMTLQEVNPGKSSSQLRYYHGPVMDAALEWLVDAGYNVNKVQARAMLEEGNPHLIDTITDKDGGTSTVKIGLSDCTVERMGKVIDWAVQQLAENGFVVESAEEWREKHKIQAWFHDKGIGHAPALRELEEQAEAGREQWLTAAPRIEDAILSRRNAEDYARGRIRFEQAPTLLKLDELEELRREKVRQEFEQKNRQQAEKKAERERAAVPQDFRAMAAKREAKASGWSDRGEQWKAAPQGLRTLIDGYNAAPKEMRPAILDRILNDGQRREQVRELMAEQRQQYRANDRGMER
jgi:hypothetical protein